MEPSYKVEVVTPPKTIWVMLIGELNSLPWPDQGLTPPELRCRSMPSFRWSTMFE